MPSFFVTRRLLLAVLLWMVSLSADSVRAGPAPQTELVVAAAASLTEALKEIGNNYQKQHPNIKLSFNFASSGTLQKQIEHGAPVDVFAAAADQNMDELTTRQLIEKGSRRVLAGNVLVLIVSRDSKTKLRRFKDVASSQVSLVAIGGPSVPAGMRAQEVFTRLGIWETILAKAVRGKDVREVMTQVELGNVEAGVVYATDAAVSGKVRTVAIAPSAMHKPIRYPIAVMSGSKHKKEAGKFVHYLGSSAAKKILKRYKFIMLKD